MDVQLENNRIQEDAEAINFDLNNKVEYMILTFHERKFFSTSVNFNGAFIMLWKKLDA